MAYFDNAATTLRKPQEVIEGVDRAMRELNVNYGRGQHALASRAYSLVSETRELVTEVMGAHSKQVVFIPTATEALNVLIRGSHSKSRPLSEGDTVYISPFEHNAVTRTLEYIMNSRGVTVEVLDLGDEGYQEKVNAQFVRKQPDMIVMTHASNVTGEVLPVGKVFELAKQSNSECVTILDMAQTAGKKVAQNVANLETVDAVVFSGHKSLYAPFGASGMLIKPNLHIEPLVFGGTGFESANQNMPESIPERFEVGSVDVPSIAGLRAACKWRLDNQQEVWEKEEENYQRLVNALSAMNCCISIKNLSTNNRVVNENSISQNAGVVSILPPNGISVDKFGHELSDFDVQVRTGLHCAPLAHQHLGTFPSGTVRFSTSYFTDDADFKTLDKALGEISR